MKELLSSARTEGSAWLRRLRSPCNLHSRTTLYQRLHKEPGPHEGDDRSPFEEDRDIVLYSSAFKRLLSVTQVASASAGYLFHTRLTHSLQVAQVGQRLAEKLLKKQPELAQELGGLDASIVETACLAHDIGHPPFGHLAEDALDEKARSFGGFEGNAQSFRIVTQLGIRSLNYRGLNLTVGSLRGLLKYPWLYADRPSDPNHATGKKPKWGAYDCDRDAFVNVWGLDGSDRVVRRAPEAELMDWADDVTYSVHDVEDFFRAGLIPLHLLKSYGVSKGREPKNPLRRERKERERFFEYIVQNERKDKILTGLSVEEIAEIFDDLLIYAAFAFEQPYEGTREDHAHLRTFTSRLISRFINELQLRAPDGDGGSTVTKAVLAQQELAILKQLTWFYVIEAPALAMQHQAQDKIIRKLADIFLQEAHQEKPSGVLPIYYRELFRMPDMTDTEKSRAAIDLIAGMTESQATAVYQRIEGISLSSGIDKILV
ncbi:deoxyguanosinetriphosphate triphosphohydrolase family protein [Edaphobacter aggregans]|uniref:deoxyguanosinetriphosphate triphosphohydrolase family protein n=1 Tax=Edaphobacter aggregans TaxID=570835 RepID=UPI000F737A4A|nr:dNTP triphosphohydrolase [Edaphobacter aggregans]